MACDLFPMDFGVIPNGSSMNLVCKLEAFSHDHSGHLMTCLTGGKRFTLDGLIDASFTKFTLLDCVLVRQYPTPVIKITDKTQVLGHATPTWDAMHSLIDLCAGFGGLSQGALAAGFEVAVAVDMNSKMLELYGKVNNAPQVCGDFGQTEVIGEIWRRARGALALSAGFSCQPFSRLGDAKSSDDVRSSCLSKTLAVAYYLQSKVVVLECVAPAANDDFVKAELAHFMQVTGFTCSQTDLKLDQQWPCRRHRAWWILVSPEFGPIDLKQWYALGSITMVQQIIPEIRLWDHDDECALQLDSEELEAFGVTRDEHGRYLLNGKFVAPCALHAWCSQIRACPCGCRLYPLSASRLAAKGLHGCLVRSAVNQAGNTSIRHIHPNEAMGLNTMDPVQDFGTSVRLTLSAVGQIAAPLQALWVWSHVSSKFEQLKNENNQFDPNAQIQAHRAWLLMRCRQVWSGANDVTNDDKLEAMIGFWSHHKDLSLAEVLHPNRWQGLNKDYPSIAAVLDHIIRTNPVSPPAQCEEFDQDAPTPWFDSPGIVDDPTTVGCMYADSCTVMFEGTSDSPVRVQPQCNSTIGEFFVAHEKLVGKMVVESITLNGRLIPLDHVLEIGQVIVIKLISEDVLNAVCDTAIGSPIHVSPTAPWTHPPKENDSLPSPPRKISKYDVGECMIPKPNQVSETAWLDATPLLGLQGNQFLRLQMPSLTTAQQLWAIRHQFLQTKDRMEVLDRQSNLFADDEIRFHLVRIAEQYNHTHGNKPAQVIDPLLASAWVNGKGFDRALWAKDHAGIRQGHMSMISAVLMEQHWIPVFLTP